MSEWNISADALIKVGGKWIRRSAVVAVDLDDGGSLVYLSGGGTVQVPRKPDDVVGELFKEVRA